LLWRTDAEENADAIYIIGFISQLTGNSQQLTSQRRPYTEYLIPSNYITMPV